MKQTDQYGLNQWELSDRIRMEDFNADNAKIDTALAGMLGRASLYWMTPPGQDGECRTKSIDPSGLVKDWSNYEYVVMMVDFPESPYRTGKPLEIGIGNPADVVFTIPEDSFLVIFRPRRDASSKIQGTVLSAGGVKFFTSQHTFDQFNHVSIKPTGGHTSATGLAFVGFR